jgi:hypothetical protein
MGHAADSRLAYLKNFGKLLGRQEFFAIRHDQVSGFGCQVPAPTTDT